MKPRLKEIERLAAVALDAMQEAMEGGDTSSTEVVSACFSVAFSSLVAVKECDGNMEAFRGPIEKMWALLPKQETN